jgi:hypothetical protein
MIKKLEILKKELKEKIEIKKINDKKGRWEHIGLTRF